ncbi:hypothetical protein LEP1GSC199_3996 [Leptospira vanthielii serovar Holland str. Waz Holland = ATCC 700522]|uniref:Uncharacterized protein n=1 Tax=Leptospira vanthielii serovar Holland str. Waz Holland = ATCC 700522 TaxID=1218591 RepID=N1WFU7_9LEPT|nr:hypothetical protein LEP1GSC199_3996 [Leptospira vanthielii serovar Holland str. Waz Holland = ATCC 700522]
MLHANAQCGSKALVSGWLFFRTKVEIQCSGNEKTSCATDFLIPNIK